MLIIPSIFAPGNPRLEPPTNRGAGPSHSEVTRVKATAMIDTMRVAGRISGHSIDASRFRGGTDRNGRFHYTFTSATGKLDAAVIQVRDTPRGLEAVVERSLPDLMFGHNLIPVTIDQAMVTVADLHRQASSFVNFIDEPHELRIDRLDLDRGFDGVYHPHHLLTHLAQLSVPRTANPSLHYDAKHHGGALTLERGTSSRTWRAVLYDKGTQMNHLVSREQEPGRKARLERAAQQARGHLRFEAQLHADYLRSRGVRTMVDLNEQILVGLREECFNRARFGTPVGGAALLDGVQVRLAGSGDPDYKFFGQVLAMLRAEALGLPQSFSGSATLTKYRSLAKKWGLSDADVLTAVGPAVALDYATGTLRAA
jgi:hypothetical protein